VENEVGGEYAVLFDDGEECNGEQGGGKVRLYDTHRPEAA
jgi:hypothetical protein